MDEVAIKFRGKKWYIDKEVFVCNSDLAADVFYRETKEDKTGTLVVPDDQDGITEHAIDCMVQYFIEGGEYRAWEYTRGGGICCFLLAWINPIRYGNDALQEMPDFFMTARYFQSDSMDVMLKMCVSQNFTALMCMKGRNPTANTYIPHTQAICEALGQAFDPAVRPAPKEGKGQTAETKINGRIEENNTVVENAADETASNSLLSAPQKHEAGQHTAKDDDLETASGSLDHPLSDSTSQPTQPSSDTIQSPPPPFFTIPLHPALSVLRETYLEQLYKNRFDLLNNTHFLDYLSHQPHLSSAFLKHIALQGGLRAEYEFPSPGALDGGGAGAATRMDSNSTTGTQVKVRVVSVAPSPLRHGSIAPANFIHHRHSLLNCCDWLEWIAGQEGLMGTFWADMAWMDGLGRLRRKKGAAARTKYRMAPY